MSPTTSVPCSQRVDNFFNNSNERIQRMPLLIQDTIQGVRRLTVSSLRAIEDEIAESKSASYSFTDLAIKIAKIALVTFMVCSNPLFALAGTVVGLALKHQINSLELKLQEQTAAVKAAWIISAISMSIVAPQFLCAAGMAALTSNLSESSLPENIMSSIQEALNGAAQMFSGRTQRA